MGRLKHRSLRINAFATGILIFIGLTTQAQEWQLSLQASQGLGYQIDDMNVYEPGFSGAGLRIDRIQKFDSTPISMVNGIEYSFQGWGSQLLLNTGLRYTIIQSGRISLSTFLHVYNGIALFNPKPLYSAGIEPGIQFRFSLSPKLHIGCSAAFRYSACPAYKNYGKIISYSDLPITLNLSKTLY